MGQIELDFRIGFPSGAKALVSIWQFSMYGLKPVPFKLKPVPFKLKPVRFKLQPVRFKLKPVRFKLQLVPFSGKP